MYSNSINEFKKISFQKEVILKLKEEINHINRALESLKEAHTSIIDKRYNVSDTLVERIEKVKYVTCPSLKLEIETLKGQLTRATSLSCTCSSFLSEKGTTFKKNPHVIRRSRKSISSKATCIYYGDKGHIMPLCNVRDVQVPNGKMTWITKCTSTNPK